MKSTILLAAFLATVLFAGCNQAEGDPAANAGAASGKAPVESASSAGGPAGQSDKAPVGELAQPQPITLGSGEQVTAVSVGYFDQNMKDLSGLVAIEGKVQESHPDRGALILVDCSVEAGCTDGCCPEAVVPVRLDMANYSGELPSADAEVVIVGDLSVQELGYTLDVREIRSGSEVLLSRST